ncbi:42864_t:CDS:2 [Gigaspora margarita]|uniref:42864_t:CDS:1 n=1 Tax=Gigaspora margarita TaxID=4874 RepID=A0ABN7VR64_GIGMA|nr:42864_t:CDS:2 [Gigaspora margarita]
MLDSNLSSVNMNIEKTKHKFVSLLDNKLLIVIGTYSVSKEKVFWVGSALTNNPYEASIFDKNKA